MGGRDKSEGLALILVNNLLGLPLRGEAVSSPFFRCFSNGSLLLVHPINFGLHIGSSLPHKVMSPTPRSSRGCSALLHHF